MIWEIFNAAVHSVGTATTMTAAGVYLHRRGMITSETKTGMARYTQQIAIPALFFSKIVDCPQDFSNNVCPNILDHLGDAWVLLVWPLYVLGIGLLVGYLVIRVTQPPKWQQNCILTATAFANAMGMPITLLDVIGHNFVPPGNVNHKLDPSMFQSIYVILNPVLQWGLGGFLLSPDAEQESGKKKKKKRRMQKKNSNGNSAYNSVDSSDDDFDDDDDDDPEASPKPQHHYYFTPLRRNNFSIPSLEDAGFNSIKPYYHQNSHHPHHHPHNNHHHHHHHQPHHSPHRSNKQKLRRNMYSIPSLEDAGFADERTGLVIQTVREEQKQRNDTPSLSDDEDGNNNNNNTGGEDDSYFHGGLTDDEFSQNPKEPPVKQETSSTSSSVKKNETMQILSKIASKAMQPPAIGAMAGFLVASYAPLRGLFVDMTHRADNAPLEWIFDGILTLAQSAIPVNMCVVGVNLSIASQQQSSSNGMSVDPKTIVGVVLGKLLIMPLFGIGTVYLLKTYVWDIPEQIQFQFYLVLLMNFITPTANVVMVIAELGAGAAAKNVMAALIGYQYVVAPFLLSLTVMLCVWMAVM